MTSTQIMPPPPVDADVSRLAPKFRAAVTRALASCTARGLDAYVYEAGRSNALQQYYYAEGRTAPGPIVTNAPTSLYSWHGYFLAVDIISRSQQWDAPEEWFQEVADCFAREGCKWGGDWRMRDLTHFQWGACRPSPSDIARTIILNYGLSAVWQVVGAA